MLNFVLFTRYVQNMKLTFSYPSNYHSNHTYKMLSDIGAPPTATPMGFPLQELLISLQPEGFKAHAFITLQVTAKLGSRFHSLT